jgi:hypothetical protein
MSVTTRTSLVTNSVLVPGGIDQIPPVKILINIGSCLDIPTGTWVKGIHGENILLGGLGALTGVAGRGNMFKSTILHFMMLSAMNRLFWLNPTSCITYDTEINMHEDGLRRLITQFDNLSQYDLFQDRLWLISDRANYFANSWFEKLKEFLRNKIKAGGSITFETPFMNRDRKSLYSCMFPSFCQVDSLSKFETEDVAKMQDDNELGESGGNTIHMRQGLAKTRFLMEVPTLSAQAQQFFLMTAQVGDATNIQAGPMSVPPPKKLQHMKPNEKFKGVTDQFFYLTNNFWQAVGCSLLVNQTTKAPEFPRNSSENNTSGDTDLNLVSLKQLRGKMGRAGFIIDLVVSQDEGVIPSLTEFVNIKNEDRFGLGGNDRNYFLDLYPEVNLSRTTIRQKLSSDLKLQRAMNITSELCQMHRYHRQYEHLLCSPKELYEGLKAKGFDWNMILSETRGWWTFENDKHPLKFLSTLDLLELKAGIQEKPYWMK